MRRAVVAECNPPSVGIALTRVCAVPCVLQKGCDMSTVSKSRAVSLSAEVANAVREFTRSDALIVKIVRGIPTDSGTFDMLVVLDNSTGRKTEYFLNATLPETVNEKSGVSELMYAVRRMPAKTVSED